MTRLKPINLARLTAFAGTLVPLTLVSMGGAGSAYAQTMSATSSAYESGYGRTRGQEEQAINPSTRDASGNRVIVDGVIITGSDNSVYAYGRATGAGDAYSGAGAQGGATAIGNNLSVVVSGNYNTVVVNSTQTNNGNVTAQSGTDITGTLNGLD